MKKKDKEYKYHYSIGGPFDTRTHFTVEGKELTDEELEDKAWDLYGDPAGRGRSFWTSISVTPKGRGTQDMNLKLLL